MSSTARNNLKLLFAFLGALGSFSATPYTHVPMSASVYYIRDNADLNVDSEWEKSAGERFRHTIYVYSEKGGSLLFVSPTTHVNGGFDAVWKHHYVLPWATSGISRRSYFIRVEFMVERWALFGFRDELYAVDFAIKRPSDFMTPIAVEPYRVYFPGISAFYSKFGARRIEGERLFVDRYARKPHGVSYRGFCLSDQTLYFHGLNGDFDPKMDVYLYIFSYLEDFPAADLTSFQGRRARRFPLANHYVGKRWEGGIDYGCFRFQTRHSYEVDKATLRMKKTDSPIPAGEAFFAHDVFLPLGSGHDREIYQACLAFRNVGKTRCSFYFPFSLREADHFFGSCEDNAYCVALGEYRDD